jgi:preprotein translocase subunit SecG
MKENSQLLPSKGSPRSSARSQLVCALFFTGIAVAMAFMPSYWIRSDLLSSRVEPFVGQHARQSMNQTMAVAATLQFVGLAFLLRFILRLPRSRRPWPCFLATIPAAILSFYAVLIGLPGQKFG